MGVPHVPNVGHAASERENNLLDANDDRRNASVPINFTASDLLRTKMLQKVVDFGILEIPICA